MILGIVPLLVLAFASFRLTRFLVIDDLITGLRSKLHTFLINRAQKSGPLHLVWDKLYELSTCTWCAGFWVSVILYTVYVWTEPWFFSRFDVFNILAIAGIQGLLHAYEPGDE